MSSHRKCSCCEETTTSSSSSLSDHSGNRTPSTDRLFQMSQTLMESGGSLRSTRSRQLFLSTRLPIHIASSEEEENNNNNARRAHSEPPRMQQSPEQAALSLSEKEESSPVVVTRSGRPTKKKLDFSEWDCSSGRKKYTRKKKTTTTKQLPSVDDECGEGASTVLTPGVVPVQPLSLPKFQKPKRMILESRAATATPLPPPPDYDLDSDDDAFMSSGQWPTDEVTFERCMERLETATKPGMEALSSIKGVSEVIKETIFEHWKMKKAPTSFKLRIPAVADVWKRHPYDCFAPRNNENNTSKKLQNRQNANSPPLDRSGFQDGVVVIDEDEGEIVFNPPEGFQNYVPTPENKRMRLYSRRN